MNKELVKIILVDGREIDLELYPEIAPISVENFLSLVDKKFYDGVIFHRVIDRFMIQTGGYYIEENSLLEKEETKSYIDEVEEYYKNMAKYTVEK